MAERTCDHAEAEATARGILEHATPNRIFSSKTNLAVAYLDLLGLLRQMDRGCSVSGTMEAKRKLRALAGAVSP